MENKIATTVEQGKRLAELGMDLSTADMSYCNDTINRDNYRLDILPLEEAIELVSDYCPDMLEKLDFVPAWSLSALMKILPKGTILIKDSVTENYHICSKGYIPNKYISAENPIDAAFEMVCYLKEKLIIE